MKGDGTKRTNKLCRSFLQLYTHGVVCRLGKVACMHGWMAPSLSRVHTSAVVSHQLALPPALLLQAARGGDGTRSEGARAVAAESHPCGTGSSEATMGQTPSREDAEAFFQQQPPPSTGLGAPGASSRMQRPGRGGARGARRPRWRSARLTRHLGSRALSAGVLAAGSGTLADPDQSSRPQLVPTVLQWSLGGGTVHVTGSFNHWGERIPLRRSGGDFVVCLNLLPGTYQYKFIVDNEWRYATDQQTVRDEMGNINNCLVVEDQTMYLNEDPCSGFFGNNPSNVYTQSLPDEVTLAKEPPAVPPHLGVRAPARGSWSRSAAAARQLPATLLPPAAPLHSAALACAATCASGTRRVARATDGSAMLARALAGRRRCLPSTSRRCQSPGQRRGRCGRRKW